MFANDLMVHSASVFPVRDWQLGCSKVPLNKRGWKIPIKPSKIWSFPVKIDGWHQGATRWTPPPEAVRSADDSPCTFRGLVAMLALHKTHRGASHFGHFGSSQFLSPKFDLQIGGRCGWFPDLWMGWNRGFTALMEGLWLTILPSCFDPVSLRVLPLRVSLARYDSNMGDRWPKNESCFRIKNA